MSDDLAGDPRTQPFAFGEGAPACLLLHGFTGTPYEVRPLGETLAHRGFHVVGPCLAGHATTPEALRHVGREDWYRSARDALLAFEPAARVHVAGLSMGAMIAVLLARDLPERVASLTLLAPAVRFRGMARLYFELFRHRPAAWIRPYVDKGGVDLADGEAALRAPSLARVPTAPAREALRLIAEAREALAEIHQPSLVLYGGRDATISEAGVRELVEGLGEPPVRVVRLACSGHLLPLDAERERVFAEVGGFLEGLEAMRA